MLNWSSMSTRDRPDGSVSRNRRDGLTEGRVASLNEFDEPTLQGAAFQHDVAIAALTAQADISAEAIDEPFPGSTGMVSPETDDVAESELDHDGRIRRHYLDLWSWIGGTQFMWRTSLSEATSVVRATDEWMSSRRSRIESRRLCLATKRQRVVDVRPTSSGEPG
jgi:hypothetical protein